MRKTFKLLTALALLLCLLCGASALAGQKTNAILFAMDREGRRNEDPVDSICAIGDTMYILTGSSKLYRYTADMTEAELVADVRPSTKTDADGEEIGYSLSSLFTDGQTLYGLCDANGAVVRLISDAGAYDMQPVCTVDLSSTKTVSDEYVDYGNTLNLFAKAGKIYLLVETYTDVNNKTVLIQYDLATGAIEKTLEMPGALSVCAMDDTKLLLIEENEAGAYNQETYEENPNQLYTFDPATGDKALVADLLSTSDVGVGYYAPTNTAYFISSAAVYAVDGLAGAPRLCAYLPTRVWRGSGMSFALVGCDLYGYGSYEGLYIRGLDMPSLANGALSVYGEYGSDEHNAVVAARPDLTFTVMDQWLDGIEALTNAMISGEANVDVLKLDSTYSPVSRLIDKGYATPLNDHPEVMAAIDGIEPKLLERYTRDGKLYAVPVSLNAYGFGYNPATLEQLGLTEDDLPKTFPEMMDFISNFYYDYGEDHPDINLFDDFNIRNSLSQRYMSMYVATQMRDEGKVTFATDDFRNFMKSLMAIDYTEIDPYAIYGEDIWSDQDTMEEFWQRSSLFTFNIEMSSPGSCSPDNYAMPLVLAINDSAEPIIDANVSLLLINPRSKRINEGAIYVAEYLKHLSNESSQYSLFPDHNDELLNPNYEQDKEGLQEAIDNAQQELDKAAPENRAEIQQQIEYMQKDLEDYEKYRYRVSGEMVAAFREKLYPYFYVTGQTPLNDYSGSEGNQFVSIVNQFLEGAIDVDKFVKEMDNRIRMMQLEDQ